MADMTTTEVAALERLLTLASQHDTGQARRVAAFLLAWWNAENFGGFALTDAWSCDDAIVEDMVTVFGYVVRNNRYPDALGYEPQFKALIDWWHPRLGQ